MRTKLIVNPHSNRGGTQALLPKITDTLRQLGVEFELEQTRAPGQATEFARQAALHGYERVVAIGGDGTCNEVVNGLLIAAQEGHSAIMGIVPTGSGNDLAYALRIPSDTIQACNVLKNGAERIVDVGRVSVDGQTRFFANVIGLGLDAEVALDTKKAKLLRGFFMYLWSAFRVVAFGKWPYQAQFSLNGQQHQVAVTLFTVANGVRAGGGFRLTPNAKLDDGLLDICYALELSRLGVLNLLPKALRGTHIYHQSVTLDRSNKVEVAVEKGIPGHIDGEILCVDGQHFEFEVLPEALRVWVEKE